MQALFSSQTPTENASTKVQQLNPRPQKVFSKYKKYSKPCKNFQRHLAIVSQFVKQKCWLSSFSGRLSIVRCCIGTDGCLKVQRVEPQLAGAQDLLSAAESPKKIGDKLISADESAEVSPNYQLQSLLGSLAS